MTTTPSFSSFPERFKPEADHRPLAITEAQSAPTFDSFPERRAGRATRKDEPHSRKHERDREDGRERKRHNHHQYSSDRAARHKSSKSKYTEEDTHHSSSSSKVEKRDRQRSPRPLVQSEPHETTASTSSDWYTDTRGDPNNLCYGSLYAANVPRYNVRGFGIILGLHAGMRLERENNRVGKGLIVADRSEFSGSSGRLSKQSPYILQGPVKRVAIEDTGDSLIEAQADFLPLSRKTRKRKLKASDGVSNADILSRPQGHDDSDAESVEESSSQEISDEQLDEDSPERLILQRTISLERHLEEQPDDIDRWIEYSGLQSELLKTKEGDKSTLAMSAETRASSKRGFAEVSLSILEKALKAIPRNRLSSKLQLEYMRIAEHVWPPAKITARWRWLLDQMGDSDERDERQYMDLWLAYIAWREGRGLGSHDQTSEGEAGGVEDVITIYTECISSMKIAMFNSYPGEAQQENLVYLVLRACLFLKQAGFSERALAVMQAMMELTFFKPLHLRRVVESEADAKAWQTELLEGLEAFWDSDSPRIGERGSLGWHRWQGISSEPVDMDNQEAKDISGSLTDPYSSWYQQEVQAELRGRQTAKAQDLAAADDEDPFRVVLFSDISDFLFLITAPTAKLHLAYAVLNFLGLPFSLQETGTNTPFASDPYLTSHFGGATIQQGSFWPATANTKRLMNEDDWTQVETSTWQPNPFQSPIRFWSQLDDNVLPGGGAWFEVLKKPDTLDLDPLFVRNVFSSLRSVVVEPGFTAAYLAFEAAAKNFKGAAKLAKTLLSDDRENLFLWSSYASLISAQKGKAAEARQVYITCLSADRMVDDPYTVELFANWAEMEWMQGDDRASLAVTVAAFSTGSVDLTAFLEEGGPPAPAAPAILRARRTALELSGGLPLAQLKLNLFFVYLINDCHIEDALVYLHNYLARLHPSSPECEETYQVGCHLIFHHTRRHATRATLFRSFLEEAIDLFPNNTMFLSLYLFGEANGRVFGRVHKLLNEKLLKQFASVITFLWAAWAEAQMAAPTFWDEHGGGAERVRSIFLKGVESAKARRSATFWTLYIDFEITQKRVYQAKALCYRAVGELSACKDLHMLPFTPRLREHFSRKELQDWADLMIERGLRMRVPFGQYFTRQDTESDPEMDSVDDDDDGPADDALEFLQERKRLMPY